jgi:hypothetical protein
MKLTLLSTFILIISGCSEGSVEINGAEVKTISGLTAVDVTGNFEKQGFKTTKNLEGEPNTWTCKQFEAFNDYIVVATGKGPTNIVSVDATQLYTGVDSIDAAPFLGYAASLPYEKADQAAAKEWAERHAKTGGDTTISGVNFKIVANLPTNRILKIYAE